MTFHDARRWNVEDVEDGDELAGKLTGTTWTLCTAFRHRGLLFLNDSTSEDGAQEYAIVDEDTAAHDGGAEARQIESVTFGWINRARAHAIIRELAGGGAKLDLGGFDLGRVEPADEHEPCDLCR